MDGIDIWNFNPLASDHMNGLTDMDTPPGFEDSYGEECFNFAWNTTGDHGTRGPFKLYFATNFLAYALRAKTDIPEGGSAGPTLPGINIKLTDVDGVAITNNRVRLEMVCGSGMYPKPVLAPLWIPLGQYLTAELEDEYAFGVNLNVVFIGFRRIKV